MEGSCAPQNYNEIKPEDEKVYSCELTAGSIQEKEAGNTVWVGVNYTKGLTLSQIVRVISREKYDLDKKTGKLETYPSSYTFSDGNIEATVEFSSELPLIEGRKEYMYLTIKNVGDGFIGALKSGDISITDNGNIINEECLDRDMLPLKNDFPTISCEIDTAGGNYLSNYNLLILIKYNYELRKSAETQIIK